MSEDIELRGVVIKLIRAVIELRTAVALVGAATPAVQPDIQPHLEDSLRAIEDALSGFEKRAAHERS